MVPNDVYRALEDALGPENVSQELGVIDGYSWQPALNLGSRRHRYSHRQRFRDESRFRCDSKSSAINY